MPEVVETVAAESSPAVVVEAAKPQADPLQEGPMVTWTREQRNEFRTTGKTPEPKAADAASAKASSEAKAESVTESDPAKQQEKPEQPRKHQTAEGRIAQLEKAIESEWEKEDPDLVRIAQFNATIDKISGKPRRKAEVAPVTEQSKPEAKTQEHPAPAQNYQEWRKAFKPSQWIEEYAKANPEASYEDATAAMADHLGDVREDFRARGERERAQMLEISAKVAEAKTRYPNYDEVINPAVDAILGDKEIVGVVKAMLNDSEVLPDLMFTIGSKPEELASFVKMAKNEPGKALRYIALTESLIREELENAKSGASEKVVVTPAKPQTQAPKPPAEVGGRGAAPPDALVSAAQANDFPAFKAELNRRSLARLKTG